MIKVESLAAHMHLGARITHRTTFLPFDGIQVALAPLTPFFHISLSAASRPILHIGVPGGANRA